MQHWPCLCCPWLLELLPLPLGSLTWGCCGCDRLMPRCCSVVRRSSRATMLWLRARWLPRRLPRSKGSVMRDARLSPSERVTRWPWCIFTQQPMLNPSR